jgi:hypothetical protein
MAAADETPDIDPVEHGNGREQSAIQVSAPGRLEPGRSTWPIVAEA